MADPARFELTTSAFGGQRSIQLSYGSDAADHSGGPRGAQRNGRAATLQGADQLLIYTPNANLWSDLAMPPGGSGKAMRAKRLSDRKFGLAFTVFFSLIAVIAWVVSGSYQYWAIAIALAFLFVALAWPSLLMPLNRLWEQLGHGLGLVTNSVLLGTFFFAIITPFGVLMRLLSSDPMQRRTDRPGDSYFTPVRRQASSETLPDMF